MRKLLTRLGLVALVLALAAIGLAACSSDDDSAKPSSTTSGSATKCTGPSDAYVSTIGDKASFKPVVANTLTVVTSLPGPGFFEGSDDDPTKITSGYEYANAKKLQEAFGLRSTVAALGLSLRTVAQLLEEESEPAIG